MSEKPRPIRMLQLEDSPLDAEILEDRINCGGLSCDIVVVATGKQFAAALERESFDLILCDYSIPGYDGAAALELARVKQPLTPVIVVSGALGEEQAVRCLQRGATDYLIKDRLERLVPAIRRALHEATELRLRKQMEQAKRESDERWRLIIEAGPECVKLLGPDGSLRQMNPAGLKMVEADSFAQVAGHCVFPLVAPEHRASFEELVTRVFLGKSGVLEFQITGLKGTPRWVEMHAVPMRDAAGNVEALLGVTRDVTERKQAAAALARERMLLRTLIDNLPGYIYIKDIEGRFLLTNQLNVRFLGLASEAEALGNTVFDFFPPEIAGPFDADDRSVIATGKPVLGREEPYKIGDRCGWFSTTKVPVRDTAGKVTGLVGITLDITERKQARETLDRERTLLRTVIDLLPDHIYAKDAQSRFILGNKAVVQVMGADNPGNLIGKSDKDFYPPSESAEFQSDERVVLAGRPIFNKEEPVIHPDGERRFIVTTKVPLKDAAGKITGLVGIGRDFTEWKEAEEQLRESEARLANAQRMAKLGSWELELGNDTGPNRNVLRWSDEVFRIFGYQPGGIEVSSENFFRAVHPEDLPRIHAAVAQALRDRQPYNLIHRIFLPDGSQRIVQEQSEIHFDEQTGQPLKMVGTVQDITELKTVEQALEDSEALYYSLVEHLPLSVFRKDLQGRFTFANVRFCESIGKPLTEVLGKTDFDIAPADLAQSYRDGDRHVMETGKVLEAMEENRSLAGKTRFLQVLKAPLRKADGEIVGIQGIFSDVTERKELEEQLRQSQKFEAIGQLAGGVAHDFNNILTVIQGYSSMLLAGRQSPGEAANAAEQIVHASERAANLTRQLLAFSRRQVMQPRLLDLNEIVTNLTKMLQRILGEDVCLQLSLHPRPLITRADAGMLDQVLLNLVVNSRDAMPEGGQLFIETEERIFTEADTALIPDASVGRHVCLRVTDTGCGIAPELRGRIFEPFFTTKDQGKGTGLGLATVFGIVKQHGGSMTVESEVGKGTTFQIFLPAEGVTSESRGDEATGAKASGGTETILLVEDEPTVRLLTSTVLEEAGYKVIEAPDGPSALRIWEDHRDSIRLLFTDIVMPEGVSGLELAARLRARDPELRVVFTSGYSADIAGKELTLQEGQNFLPKPATPQKILQIVRQSLDE